MLWKYIFIWYFKEVQKKKDVNVHKYKVRGEQVKLFVKKMIFWLAYKDTFDLYKGDISLLDMKISVMEWMSVQKT